MCHWDFPLADRWCWHQRRQRTRRRGPLRPIRQRLLATSRQCAGPAGKRETFVFILHINEDAFTRAHVGGHDHCSHMPGVDPSETARTSRVVQHHTILDDVGNAVIELSKYVGTVIDAQAVPGTQVLVDPHSHADRLRKDRNDHQDEQCDISHDISCTDWSLTRTAEACTWRSLIIAQVLGEQRRERNEQ